MIFSQHDIDLLRILYWCQYLEPSQAGAFFSEETIHSMRAFGLLKRHTTSGSYVLTGEGRRFLRSAFPEELPPFSQTYHADAIQRRLRVSAMMLTFYQAGFHVFTLQREALLQPNSFFLSSISRGRGQNPWGSTRIGAIANLGALLCAVHFVSPSIGKLALNDELTAFHNQTSRISAASRGFFFSGSSYSEVLQELQQQEQTCGSLISYGEAYRLLRLPVFLLSCDKVGSMQLRLMTIPDYRQKISRAVLQQAYHPPPAEVPEWDAMYDGLPFVLGADMDLRRIDSASIQARALDYSKIAIAALEEQNSAVLSARYRDTGLAHTYSLSPTILSQVYGRPLAEARPPNVPFLSKEGGVVYAPLIRTGRKAGA